VVVIEVALQALAVAFVPPKVTVLVPWLEPKFVPVIVMVVPTVPDVGETSVIFGVCNTVNGTALLACPPTVTTTSPVEAPAGIVTCMEFAFQLVTVAGVPLNVTALVPWVAPKLVPVIVTDEPIAPAVSDRLLMLGPPPDSAIVNDDPVLATPFTVTTTSPVVAPVGTVAKIDGALQLVAVACVPLNVTVLVP